MTCIEKRAFIAAVFIGQILEVIVIVVLVCLLESCCIDNTVKEPMPKWFVVRMTAYPPDRRHTDDSPYVTAFNTRVRRGILAVSRDLENVYGWSYGKEVVILGVGRFVVEDRMHRRHRASVDIWVPTVREAVIVGGSFRLARCTSGETDPFSWLSCGRIPFVMTMGSVCSLDG